jgi:rRNA maturation RNase YbeY
LSIRIFYDEIKFRVRNKKRVIKLIEKVISEEKRKPGDLNFIFTNDEEERKINKEFLKQDLFTDVISFSYNDGIILNGEIYISIDTVKFNANNYKVSLNKEVLRIIIHGLLHVCGYEDKSVWEKKVMVKKENFWMSEFNYM